MKSEIDVGGRECGPCRMNLEASGHIQLSGENGTRTNLDYLMNFVLYIAWECGGDNVREIDDPRDSP